jgi:Ca2+-binding EF-hand superfamily protein
MMGGDPALMFKERFTSIQTAKNQIEKQREFDAVKDRLQKEFDLLDLNKDGLVSLEELQEFLDNKLRQQKKSPNEQFDPQITEEIYNMIDLNNDGKVTM